jgi:uncharacterized membrane protein YdjX (TVP38/TMEM64 family)
MRPDRGTLTLIALSALLLAGALIPWALWGDAFDDALTLEGATAWIMQQGDWAWAAGAGLLVSDIVLPVPSTVVMSALGVAYGTLLGGLIATAGSMLAGLTAYGAARLAGRPAARSIAGEEGLRRTEELFGQGGAWLVLVSRWMPILPEAVACMAGLAGMRFTTFLGALTAGCVPTGFAFAWVGSVARESESLAIALSLALPAAAWLAATRLRRVREARGS